MIHRCHIYVTLKSNQFSPTLINSSLTRFQKLTLHYVVMVTTRRCQSLIIERLNNSKDARYRAGESPGKCRRNYADPATSNRVENPYRAFALDSARERRDHVANRRRCNRSCILIMQMCEARERGYVGGSEVLVGISRSRAIAS